MLTRIITAVVLIAAVLAWLFKANFEVFSMGPSHKRLQHK